MYKPYAEKIAEIDACLAKITPFERGKAIQHILDKWGIPRSLLVNLLTQVTSLDEARVNGIVDDVLSESRTLGSSS